VSAAAFTIGSKGFPVYKQGVTGIQAKVYRYTSKGLPVYKQRFTGIQADRNGGAYRGMAAGCLRLELMDDC